ncbi:hypothetical protein Tco_1309094 [Tanacetum coccineum]
MSTKQRSKHNVRVPIKYNDTICDLTKNNYKDNEGINDEIADSEKVEAIDQIANGGSGDDTNRPSNEFTTYDTNFPSLTKANKQINEDCSDKEQVVKNVDDTNGYSECNNNAGMGYSSYAN